MANHQFKQLSARNSSSIHAGDRYANNYISSSGPTFEQVQQLTQQLQDLRAQLLPPTVTAKSFRLPTPQSNNTPAGGIEDQRPSVYKLGTGYTYELTAPDGNVETTTVADLRPQEEPKAKPYFLVPYDRNIRFVNRSAELTALRRHLCQPIFSKNDQVQGSLRQRRTALYGLGGAGKTQLAIELAHTYRGYFPNHSVFWVHASTEEWLRQSFQSLAAACGIDVDERGQSDVFTTVASWLKKSPFPWLMILDNADDADVLFRKRRRLADVLAECSHGSILVTTRNKRVAEKITLYGTTIEVSAMSEDQSVQLLRSFLTTKSWWNRKIIHYHDDAEINILADSLGHLPLALAQAAAYIRENSITIKDYLEMWESSSENAQLLLNKEFEADGRQYHDADVPNAVGTTLMLSLDYLRERRLRTGKMLVLISFLHYTNIYPTLLLQQSETVSHPAFVEALGDLQAFSLLQKGADGSTYAMNRLVHQIISKWRNSRLTAIQLEDAVNLAFKQLVSGFSSSRSKTDREAANMQLPHALKCLQEVSQVGVAAEATTKVYLMRRIAEHLFYQGRVLESAELRETILRVTESSAGDFSMEIVRSKCEYAEVLEHLHRFEEAQRHCQAIIDALESVGHRQQTYINAMRIMSRVHARRGNLDKALTIAEAAKEASSQHVGSSHGDTLVLNFNIVEIMRMLAAQKHVRDNYLVQAQKLLYETVAQLAQSHGENDSLTILGKQHLANVLDDLQEFDKSVEISKGIVSSKEMSLGTQHLETFQAQLGLALCFMKRAQYLEAEEIIVKAMQCSNPVVTAHHLGRPKAMQMLATIHEKRAEQWRNHLITTSPPKSNSEAGSQALDETFDYAKAVRVAYQTALSLKMEVSKYLEAAPGIEHPHTLEHIIDTSRTCMQLFLANQEQFVASIDDAERMQRDVLTVQEDLFGKKHEDTMITKGLLVVTLYHKRRLLDELEFDQGKSNSKVVSNQRKRVNLDSVKNLDEAEKLALQVYKHRLDRQGRLHRDTLDMQQMLAEIMYKQPDARPASIKLMHKCWQSTLKAFGINDEDTKAREIMYFTWETDNSAVKPSTFTSTWRMLENDYNMRRPVAYNTMKQTYFLDALGSDGKDPSPQRQRYEPVVTTTDRRGIAIPRPKVKHPWDD